MSKTANTCEICPHLCDLSKGVGKCGANPGAYGKITAIALDPIEKKPLKMFNQGSMILSVGSYGCNLHCPFCQNFEIAVQAAPHKGRNAFNQKNINPSELATLAKEKIPLGNIGVAYTYNEPLINYEYILDCAREIHAAGLKNVLVTNGFINPAPLEKLLPYIDAMNIDLKAFSQEFYKKIGGDVEVVKNTIATAAKACHVEVTTLVIPDENEDDIEPIAKWLASLNPKIPFHISRFFPMHNYANLQATSRETIFALADIARKYLTNVFEGNV
ncbi:MAG: radical SAM protein [Defluviitaleaceae bacterium]|nr:radical SAM protein [Defluviitaleaceae bacterium]